MHDLRPTDEALLAAARERPAAERASFLDGACAGDPARRARLEVRLHASSETQASATVNASDAAAPVTAKARPSVQHELLEPHAEEEIGTVIGRYKLLEKVGEGGFGVVYVAEQREPVKRRVALKIIKLGMDTRQVVARFEAERQALALMDHPNIAKVLDAGATDTGRPYFVMELVRGIRITDYCDLNNLATGERLDLFVAICHAIQHAHQKGIIHRDIKPSNILVTLHDGVPVPKVIDFGIAKATQGELTDKTVYTQLQQCIGTPAYMSPEQAEMSGLDVDTRSDIYSLGVLLYELLTGGTPFDREVLAKAGWDEMRRTIREKEPLRPSTRLSKMQVAGATALARRRGVDVPRLVALLRGDLDWIVMKCLEKDRTRRYETANGVALDLQRHLRHEPVAARPPSVAYKAKKFVRRNRLAVAAASAVVLALVLGIVGSTWQMVRATRAEREQSTQRQAAEKARSEAEQARAAAEAQRQRAEAGEQAARRHLYAADMILARQALAEGNLGRVSELLLRYRPPQPTPSTAAAQPFIDLRGWEWRYLWGEIRSEELCTLGSHGAWVAFIAFSDDGGLLATSSQATRVKIWDVAARREIAACPSSARIGSLCFVPQSRTVAVASGNGITFLDANNGQTTDVLRCEGQVGSMAFSRDGRRLAICEDRDLRLLDAASRRELWRAPVNEGWRVAFSPDGTIIAAVSQDPKVLLFDAATGRPLASLPGFSRSYFGSLVFSPDGALLACASGENGPKVLLYEVGTRRLHRELNPEGPWFGGVAFSPDGETVAISGGPYEITLYDRRTWKVIRRLRGHRNEAWAVAFSPDGKLLASGSKDSTVRLWDPNAPRLTADAQLQLPAGVDAIVLSADGNRAAALADDNTFAVWDTASLRQVATGMLPFTDVLHTGADNWTSPFAISSDGRRFATATSSGQLSVWHTETRESLAVINSGFSSVRLVVLSPDGRLIAAAGSDGTVKVWDLRSKSLVNTLPAPGGTSPRSMVFSSDSELVAVGFNSGLVQAWEIAGPRSLLSYHFNYVPIQGLAISHDRRFLASASVAPRVTLLDLQKGTRIASFTGALNSYNSVAISRDGRRLFASGRPNVLSVWDTGSLQNVGTYEGYREGTGVFNCVSVLPGDDTVVGVGSGVIHLWRAPSWAEIEAAEKNVTKGNPSP